MGTKEKQLQTTFDEALRKIKEAQGKLSKTARIELKKQCDFFTENEDTLTINQKLKLLQKSIQTIDKDLLEKHTFN